MVLNTGRQVPQNHTIGFPPGERILFSPPGQKTEIMANEKDKATQDAVAKALRSGRNANDNFNEGNVDDYGAASQEAIQERDEIKGGVGQRGTGRNANDNFNETRSYPQDQSQVIFTDLQGVRHRGIYKKTQGFQEISEIEVPLEQQSFFPEDDVAGWEYEPESRSE